MLRSLRQTQQQAKPGLSLQDLSNQLQIDPLHLQSVLERLQHLDWIGRLDENLEAGPPRYVLLVDVSWVPIQPLLSALLLAQGWTPPTIQQRWDKDKLVDWL